MKRFMSANPKPSIYIDEREYEDLPEPSEPEKRLLREVLMRAIQDATGNISQAGWIPNDPYWEETAHEWLFANEEQENTHFTFEWICEWLDLKPDRIRDFVLEARKEKTKISFIDNSVHRVPNTEKFYRPDTTLKSKPSAKLPRWEGKKAEGPRSSAKS